MSNGPRPADCPPEAARALARPGRLEHQALRANDMVASTIKPLLADALLSAPGGGRWHHGAAREQMLRALGSSDTPFFIDHLLCFEPGADPANCDRIAVLARRAAELKLAEPMDLLASAPAPAVSGAKPQARPLTLLLPGLPFDLPIWPPTGANAEVELAAARRCQDQPAKQRWRGCEGEQTAALVAPLWGQGDARGSPLGVAHLYQRQVTQPHLLAGQGRQIEAGFAKANAELILEGLRRAPLPGGTARSACVSVRGPAGCADLGLAMKTGTSLFPHHMLTAAERAERCLRTFALEDQARRGAAALSSDGRPSETVKLTGAQRKEVLNCALYPMKWAVLIEPTRDDGDALLTVVLVERNRTRADGRLDAGDDSGANVAAEAALLLHAHRLAPVPSAKAAPAASVKAGRRGSGTSRKKA